MIHKPTPEQIAAALNYLEARDIADRAWSVNPFTVKVVTGLTSSGCSSAELDAMPELTPEEAADLNVRIEQELAKPLR